MSFSRNVLVVTTSNIEGIRIIKYLKPVSTHTVAGINMFGDFLGSITDTFGGRSNTYQKQLESIYNETIEKLKYSTLQIGGNCIVGLKIDVSEISGKGKSMLMITAVGTAVEIEKQETNSNPVSHVDEKIEIVDSERMKILKEKKFVRNSIAENKLNLDDIVWDFITTYQMDDVYPYLIKRFSSRLGEFEFTNKSKEEFVDHLINYLGRIPEGKKLELVYTSIQTEKDPKLFYWLTKIVESLNLFDFEKVTELLKSDDFNIQKRGLKIATYDQSYYNSQDKQNLQNLSNYINENFPERGTRSTKKQLLSSKEKDVWNCECGKTNDTEITYCPNCFKDIYGFESNEIKPKRVCEILDEKIEFISYYIN